MNVSSFAGLIPQPDEAVYSATKAAVTAFSAALGQEVAPLGIHVLAVHPVLVATEMFTPEVMARMPKGTEERFVTAEAFAAETLAALARRERSVVIPRGYRWVVRLRALAPERFDRIVARTRLRTAGRDELASKRGRPVPSHLGQVGLRRTAADLVHLDAARGAERQRRALLGVAVGAAAPGAASSARAARRRWRRRAAAPFRSLAAGREQAGHERALGREARARAVAAEGLRDATRSRRSRPRRRGSASARATSPR